MSPTSEAPFSIRRRLQVLLLVPAAALFLAGTFADYLAASAPFRDAYDQALTDIAIALGDHIEQDGSGRAVLSVPPAALAILQKDSYDSIYFRVSGADGRHIDGNADLPLIHQGIENPARGDAKYRGEAIRLISYRSQGDAGPVTVTVGETLHKRNRAHAAVLTTSLSVDLAELSLMLLLIWAGIRFALVPLRKVATQIGARSARDLSPLRLDTVPLEIQGLVKALNSLFQTVSDTSNAQRRFLESAAHQLRTPLTGVQAQLELLVASEATDAPRRDRLQMVLDSSQRLAHTTQQLLTLARSDHAAALNWEFVPLELAPLVERVVVERLAAADAANVDLGAEIEPASAVGVEWLLNEALGNLANNAIAHTPKGGSVTIQCGVRAGAAFLQVTDTGIGIPAPERARVLERFFRASNARGLGSGLGLAIVHEVAQLHGASLSIEDGPGGRGTAIRITLNRQPTVSERT